MSCSLNPEFPCVYSASHAVITGWGEAACLLHMERSCLFCSQMLLQTESCPDLPARAWEIPHFATAEALPVVLYSSCTVLLPTGPFCSAPFVFLTHCFEALFLVSGAPVSRHTLIQSLFPSRLLSVYSEDNFSLISPPHTPFLSFWQTVNQKCCLRLRRADNYTCPRPWRWPRRDGFRWRSGSSACYWEVFSSSSNSSSQE